MSLSKPTFSIAAILLVVAFNNGPVLALSQSELEEKMRAAKLVSADDRIATELGSDEVTVQKFGIGEAVKADNDCKIEAILIAKTVLAADSNIKKVKVRFFGKSDSARYSEVLVRSVDIKGFAAGAITQDELLSSVDLKHGTTGDAVANDPSLEQAMKRISDGPLLDERKALLDRIVILNKQGINTQAFTKLFLNMNESAGSGDRSATAEALNKLTLSINDQEAALARRGQKTSLQNTAAAKQAAMPVSADTARQSSLPTSTGNAKESESELSNELERWSKWKQYSNVFNVVDGPYKTERGLIAYVLSGNLRRGKSIKQYLPMVNGLNEAASAHDKATTASRVKSAFTVLRITPQMAYEWNARNHNWQGGFEGESHEHHHKHGYH